MGIVKSKVVSTRIQDMINEIEADIQEWIGYNPDLVRKAIINSNKLMTLG